MTCHDIGTTVWLGSGSTRLPIHVFADDSVPDYVGQDDLSALQVAVNDVFSLSPTAVQLINLKYPNGLVLFITPPDNRVSALPGVAVRPNDVALPLLLKDGSHAIFQGGDDGEAFAHTPALAVRQNALNSEGAGILIHELVHKWTVEGLHLQYPASGVAEGELRSPTELVAYDTTSWHGFGRFPPDSANGPFGHGSRADIEARIRWLVNNRGEAAVQFLQSNFGPPGGATLNRPPGTAARPTLTVPFFIPEDYVTDTDTGARTPDRSPLSPRPSTPRGDPSTLPFEPPLPMVDPGLPAPDPSLTPDPSPQPSPPGKPAGQPSPPEQPPSSGAAPGGAPLGPDPGATPSGGSSASDGSSIDGGLLGALGLIAGLVGAAALTAVSGPLGLLAFVAEVAGLVAFMDSGSSTQSSDPSTPDNSAPPDPTDGDDESGDDGLVAPPQPENPESGPDQENNPPDPDANGSGDPSAYAAGIDPDPIGGEPPDDTASPAWGWGPTPKGDPPEGQPGGGGGPPPGWPGYMPPPGDPPEDAVTWNADPAGMGQMWDQAFGAAAALAQAFPSAQSKIAAALQAYFAVHPGTAPPEWLEAMGLLGSLPPGMSLGEYLQEHAQYQLSPGQTYARVAVGGPETSSPDVPSGWGPPGYPGGGGDPSDPGGGYGGGGGGGGEGGGDGGVVPTAGSDPWDPSGGINAGRGGPRPHPGDPPTL
jgi:hypothetical protein